MRRALGRRFDPEEQKMYHVEDVPPPTDKAPLCERLVPMDEDHNIEGTLIDRWISFDQGRKALENWLSQFGDKAKEQSILYKLEAEAPQTEVSQAIKAIFDSVLSTKAERESSLKQRINASLDEKERVEAEKAEQ